MAVRLNSIVQLILLLTFFRQPLTAAQHWIRAESTHFEIYTTSSAEQATLTLHVLERARTFFLNQVDVGHVPAAKVRIVAFSSENEYRPYRISPEAFAYSLRGWGRASIVIQDLETGHVQAAVHEYTHLVLRENSGHLPAWLNEGLAEFYSSLSVDDPQIVTGQLLPARLVTLTQRTWLDWSDLFNKNADSSVYRDRLQASIFYAQSWITVHLMMTSPFYAPGFPQFLSLLTQGTPTRDALHSIYGKTIAEVGKDVSEYIRQSSFRVLSYAAPQAKPECFPLFTDPSTFKVEVVLANLLACSEKTAEEAEARLLTLFRQHPEEAEIMESLGYLAWRRNSLAEARRYFASALRSGSKNIAIEDDLVRLEQAAGITHSTVTSSLGIASN